MTRETNNKEAGDGVVGNRVVSDEEPGELALNFNSSACILNEN